MTGQSSETGALQIPTGMTERGKKLAILDFRPWDELHLSLQCKTIDETLRIRDQWSVYLRWKRATESEQTILQVLAWARHRQPSVLPQAIWLWVKSWSPWTWACRTSRGFHQTNQQGRPTHSHRWGRLCNKRRFRLQTPSWGLRLYWWHHWTLRRNR